MSRTGDLLRERKAEREGAALSSRTQTLLNERFGTSASAAAGDQAVQTDWPTQNTTPSVTQADGGGSGNFFTKLGGLYTASMNMRQASEMSIYGGKKADAIAEQLDTRAEQMIASAKPEVSYVGERGAVGAAQSAEGIVNALGYMGQALSRTQNLQASQDAAMWAAVTGSDSQKALSERLEQSALDSVREGLQDTVSFGDKYDEKVEQKYADADISKLGRGTAVVSEGIGGMLPYIAASAVGGPAISTATMFFSSMGNATQEAKKEGYDDLRAMAYGSAVGAVEVATERMFDGMAGVFGKGAFDDVVQGTIRNVIKNEGVQKAVNYLVGMGGEGVEEFFAELGTRAANELTINNDDRTVWQTIKDGGKSALVGALISGIMQAGGNVAQIIRTDPAKAARQAAHAVIAEVKTGRSAVQGRMPGVTPEGGKKASAGAEAAYRAERPQNVEYPTVPIINLSLRSVAELNGGTLPQSGNSLRAAAINRARARLGLDQNSAVYIPASNVIRNGEEYVLKITRSSLNKMLSPSNGGVVAPESIVVLENIERIANNGVYFRSEGDRKGRDQIAGYDHLLTTVYIDSQPYAVDLRVRVYDALSGSENRLYYFTPEEIVTAKKVSTNFPTGTLHERTMIQETAPTSNTKVPQAVPGVNRQYSHNAPSVFLPGSGLEGLWTVGDGMLPVDEKLAQTSRWLLPVDEKLAQTSRWLLPVDEKLAQTSRWLLPLDEKLAERSMLPLSEAARQAGQTAVENRATGEYTGGEKSGHGHTGEGKFAVISEEVTQSGGKEISDSGDAESAGGMGEENARGEGGRRESYARRIKEILRRTADRRNKKVADGRDSGRVETKEARDSFEDRVRGEGCMYVEVVAKRVAVAFKVAAKQKWNANAKAAAEKLESWGFDVIVFDGEVHTNKKGVTETHKDGFTLRDKGNMTIFLSAELDIDGMETAFHEAFHAARFDPMLQYRNEIVDVIESNIDVDSEAFEAFINDIADLYAYAESEVSADAFADEIIEESYAWYIGKSHAANGGVWGERIAQFSDMDSARAQIDAIYAKMETAKDREEFWYSR